MQTRDEVEGLNNCREFSQLLETVMQSRDEVEGLHNCRRFSQPFERLYQAMQTQEKSFLLLNYYIYFNINIIFIPFFFTAYAGRH